MHKIRMQQEHAKETNNSNYIVWHPLLETLPLTLYSVASEGSVWYLLLETLPLTLYSVASDGSVWYLLL